jgi:ElaB/YqjD/DUF883 family membrane-anchored ribosome-binding protein
MDQRPDQLSEPGWLEDRSTSLPDTESETIMAETVEYPDSETERIKAEIEDTRAEMGQTINEIQERLSPEHLMGQVKETVREATIGKVERVMDKVGEKISNVTEPAMEAMGRAGETLKETGYSLTNTVRQNPIPCALIGLGIGMFVVNRIRNADGGTGTTAYQSDFESGMAKPMYAGMGRQYSSRSGEYAGASRPYGSSKSSMFSQVKETAGGFAHDAGEKVSELSYQATEGARRAGRSLQRLVYENPLAVGAAAVAVGAAVGLVLPATRVEQEYMGEASEKLMDKAQQAAREAMDKVKTVTQGDEPKPAQPQPGQPGM